MKRKIVVFFMILICFLLQCTVFQALSLGGIVPNLLIMLTSSFGFMKGRKEGIFVGFISGMLIDVFYSSFYGGYALIYMVIGYANGYFHRIFYPEDVKLPIIFITVSDFIYCIITYVFLFLLRTRIHFFFYLKSVIFPELVYTVVITVIFYRLILLIHRKLEESEKRSASKFV
ncbi:rod shape-determining protein MreD [bacterium C-53]|nr:rod shape-determining protein MreD [Lachnospiraceae bacterium]NBI01909.1 rod shape-determining protein MreD [Lachnospiraceae bacterium]RKJ12312.1 rod shape-determining protein MreD [bacterium C-53]